jgi:RNA polymerase sigma-70 factor (ECF subfamily)
MMSSRVTDETVRRLPQPAAEVISDAALVERARQGEAWAFEALYRRHAPAVLRTTARVLARRGDAEDVTQDAFATALEKLDTLDDPSVFRAWVMRTAVRAARWKLRRRAFGRALGVEPGEFDATLDRLASTDAGAEVRLQLAEVAKKLERLPADHRIAWVLRVVEGHPIADIAEYTGASVASVKRWIAKTDALVGAHVEPEVEP